MVCGCSLLGSTRSAVASPFFARQNANLAGGFAGRPGLFGFLIFFLF